MIAAGGDRPKTIRISVPRDGASVLRVIADTGPGIPQTRERNVRTLFHHQARGRGTGQGAAGVPPNRGERGGRLEFVTEVNRGTTFWF